MAMARWSWVGWMVGMLGVVIWGTGFWSAGQVWPHDSQAHASAEPHSRAPPCIDHISGFVQSHRNGPTEGVGASVYDLNGDGTPEVLVAYQHAKSLEVLSGFGPTEHVTISTTAIGRAGSAPIVGDINGDRWPDILVPEPDDVAIRLILGEPTLHLSGGFTIEQPEEVRRIRIADVDGDGLGDMLIDPRGVLGWRKGYGQGNFGGQQPLVPSSTLWVATLDGGAVLLHDDDGYKLLRLPLEPRRDAELVDARDWPQDPMGAVFLDADVDHDGAREIYIADLQHGTILRWQPHQGTCEVATGTLPFRSQHLTAAADLNNDHHVDFITVETCQGCTSSITMWRGTK